MVVASGHRQSRGQQAVLRFENGRGVDAQHLDCDVGHQVRRIRAVDRREEHTPTGAVCVDGQGRGDGGLARTAGSDDERDPRGGLGNAIAQPSTRFFNSFNAVSVMTFSALRLNKPIMGMARSTVSS